MELGRWKAIEVTRFTSLRSKDILKTFKAALLKQFTETFGILFS